MSARKIGYHRKPRTRQEKRRYHEDKKYVRGKRSSRNLPDGWSDIPIKNNKNWKNKRKTQYREKGSTWGKYIIYLYDEPGKLWKSRVSIQSWRNITDLLDSLKYYYESNWSLREYIIITYWGEDIGYGNIC